MRPAPDPQAVARGLVLSVRPALEARMRPGQPYREAMRDVLAQHGAGWAARHGADVAHRARMILDGLGAAMVLTPYGLELFMREGPVEAITPCRGNAYPS